MVGISLVKNYNLYNKSYKRCGRLPFMKKILLQYKLKCRETNKKIRVEQKKLKN